MLRFSYQNKMLKWLGKVKRAFLVQSRWGPKYALDKVLECMKNRCTLSCGYVAITTVGYSNENRKSRMEHSRWLSAASVNICRAFDLLFMRCLFCWPPSPLDLLTAFQSMLCSERVP